MHQQVSLLRILHRATTTRSQMILSRNLNSKIPTKTLWKEIHDKDLRPAVKVDQELIEYLERITLVRFNNEDGVRQLHEAIRFADRLQVVNTENVKPLFSLNENDTCYLRDDEITEGNCQDDLFPLAEKKVEDMYYVAPPGNIPLKRFEKEDDRSS